MRFMSFGYTSFKILNFISFEDPSIAISFNVISKTTYWDYRINGTYSVIKINKETNFK